MGKILGIRIQNYGSLKDVKMGRLFSDQSGEDLDNMVVIIGASGTGKSTLADAFGFISDCLSTDVETACDASHRGGYDQLVSQGTDAPIHFEIYYRETSNARPITYELTINKDDENRPYVEEERLRQRRQGNSYGQGADEEGLPDLCGARQAQARVGGEHRAAHVPGCKCIAEFSIFFERDPKADFAGNRVSV